LSKLKGNKDFQLANIIGAQFVAGQGSALEGLKRVSKPGCRVYTGKDRISQVLNGFGINIIFTSKGVMTDDMAKRTIRKSEGA
tara:strand:+ start:1329 stop:1577 length:249 start_codon:yes stop_codon:yes gene_type:complete